MVAVKMKAHGDLQKRGMLSPLQPLRVASIACRLVNSTMLSPYGVVRRLLDLLSVCWFFYCGGRALQTMDCFCGRHTLRTKSVFSTRQCSDQGKPTPSARYRHMSREVDF